MINAELLAALLSPDGAQRSQAEAVLNSMELTVRIDGLMSSLMSTSNFAPEQQFLSAVLLRRDLLKVTDERIMSRVVSPLLQCFTDESRSASFRLQLGHCIAGLCASYSLVGSSILPSILPNIEPAVSRFDIPSLRLLANIAECAPVDFKTHVVAHLPGLVGAVADTAVKQHPDVMLEVIVNGSIAASASTNVGPMAGFGISPNPEEIVIDEPGNASKLGPSLLKVLNHVAVSSDENSIQASLQHLVQAATMCPSLLVSNKPVLESVVGTCLQLAGTNSENYDLRLSALQVLASLVLVGDFRRRILVKYPDVASTIIGQVVPLCAHLVVSGVEDDIQEWAEDPPKLIDEDGSGWDNDQASRHAESLLADFLHSLGSPALAVALPIVQELITNQEDWKRPRAALAIVEVCLSATPVGLTQHIPTSLEAALSLADSTNLRVQWQAIRLLAALCENDKVDIRESRGGPVLEKIARATNSPCPKVSAMALLSLVSYCRGGQSGSIDIDTSAAVVPYLPDVLGALIQGPLSLTSVDTGTVCIRVRYVSLTVCRRSDDDRSRYVVHLVLLFLLSPPTTLSTPSMIFAGL